MLTLIKLINMKNPNFLNFTAVNGNAMIGLLATTSPDVQYSFDGKNWVAWDYKAITISDGSTVFLKGNNPKGFSKGFPKYNFFMMQGKIEAHGNIMSLIYGEHCDSNLTIPNARCFECLFLVCDSLLTAPELPATTLTERCYDSMFSGCRSLVEAPELPATTLTERCYQFMFSDCRSLVEAPELPAKELRRECYWGMFDGCTSLIVAPELPALNLADCCYSNMFKDCESLVDAPELPSETLTLYCYGSMFEGCKSLVMAPLLPAQSLHRGCYRRMFFGCKSLQYVYALFEDKSHLISTKSWLYGVSKYGQFVKSRRAKWNDTGTSGIPKGWRWVQA